MIEYRHYLLSRVMPDSEVHYRKAIKEAIADLQRRILNVPDGSWTQARVEYLLDLFTKALKIPQKDFIKLLKDETFDILELDNGANFNEAGAINALADTPVKLYNLTRVDIKHAMRASEAVFVYRTKAGGDTRSAVDIYSYYAVTSRRLLERIRSTINGGILSGQSSASIARALPPQQTYVFSQLRTLVRTMLMQSANNANVELIAKNSEFYEWWEYSAVLDNRTTQICRDLDGRRWKEKPKLYDPPLHFNCRSILRGVPYNEPKGKRFITYIKGGKRIVKEVDADLNFRELEKIYPELKKTNTLSMAKYKKLMLQFE